MDQSSKHNNILTQNGRKIGRQMKKNNLHDIKTKVQKNYPIYPILMYHLMNTKIYLNTLNLVSCCV